MKKLKTFEEYGMKHKNDETMNESLGVWIGAGAAMGLLWLIRKLMKHVKDTNNSWNRHKFLQAINQTLSTLKSDDLYDTQEAFQITEYSHLYYIKANIDSEEIMPDIRIMKEKGIPASWVTKINDAGASEHDEVIKEKLSVYYLMFGNETIELRESEHKELVDKIKELLK